MTVRRALPLALLAALSVAPGAASGARDAARGDEALGRRIYREGLLPSGRPLHATVEGDVPIAGAQSRCAGCHGRSGFGAAEGSRLVPPVTGPALFDASGAWRVDPRGVQPPNGLSRAAYDEASLARALRDGVAPGGRLLDPMMPRYRLGEDEMAHLVAYLRSLSAAPSPGVGDESLRLATVVTEGVDADTRDTMLGVLEGFLRDWNAETRAESARRARGAWDHAPTSQAYRRWQLEVWTLTGPRASWREQLESRDRASPVFALISGAAAGEWLPIHEFCEAREVPCVLPNTDLPPDGEPGFYGIYFSRGMRLEADVLARYLAEPDRARLRVVQIVGSSPEAEAAGRRLAQVLGATGRPVATVPRDAARQRDGARFWRELLRRERPEALVAWLGDAELAGWQEGLGAGGPPIFLSSSLLEGGAEAVPEALSGRVFFVHPFEPSLNGGGPPAIRRWAERHGIAARAPHVEANTYFAATAVRRAAKHIAGNFSRDYFVETLEHQVETSRSPSLYPRLGLGRGQRFASKGAYVLRVPGGANALAPAGPWIVP